MNDDQNGSVERGVVVTGFRCRPRREPKLSA
jgi:hypothetical protein